MKAKQKKIRVFDIVIDSEDKFFSYMDKNLILLKDYLLIIRGEVTEGVKHSQNIYSVIYLFSGADPGRLNSRANRSFCFKNEV